MVAVAVRHDDEIQLGEIDALGLDVVGEDVRVVAGVEQNPLAVDFDQGGVAPVLLRRRVLAEGVVENGDLRLRRRRGARRGC